METVTPEQKQPIIKTLAVTGLLGLIIGISWLAIQAVQVLPKAADSLAALANSVYNYNPNSTTKLEIASGQTMVDTSESFKISWKKPKQNGTFAFTYTCLEGVTMDIATTDNTFYQAECDKSYELGDKTEVELTVTTTENRFTEVFYTINFFKTNAATPTSAHNGKVTIVNANLFAEASTATTTAEIITEPVATTTPAEVTTPTDVEEEIPTTTEEPAAEEVAPVTTEEPTAAETVTATQPEYIYEIPLSQKDGQSDLLASFISLGSIDTNGAFIKSTTLPAGVTGAIQFSVHNIGNKTSEDWSFKALLPGDLEFTSNTQKPLLPNERSLLTLQFKAVPTASVQSYEIEVVTTADKNNRNNTITGQALVTNK